MRRLLLWCLALALLLTGCGGASAPQPETAARELSYSDLSVQSSMELFYARQFQVDFFQAGIKRLTVGENTYLLLPENLPTLPGVPEDITVLRQPLDRIYLAATSAMDLLRELEAIDRIRFSGTDVTGWYIPEAVEAMRGGDMAYAGKYSAPDYELLLDGGCDLAIESTMIYHTPEVQEQLERLGIPVLVERSSYESHPLGRMEWIRLYGALLGREAEADAYFQALLSALEPVMEQPPTGKTVAFFYITSSGAVNVRKSGDYIAQSIALAGGSYLPENLGGEDNAMATVNMQMEAFYDQAKDADVLIYNSAIDGELQTVEQLLEKSGVLKDFKAVKTGNVWCTGKNLFQQSLSLGDLILEIHQILTQQSPQGLTLLHQLE